MSQIQYSNAFPPMFNIPTQEPSEVNALWFYALTATEENNGYKLAKAMRAPPQNTFSIPSSRAPFVARENVVLGSSERSPEGLKRVTTITKSAGKKIRQRRRKDKENLAISFFANGF